MTTQACRDLAQALQLAESDLGLVIEYRAILLPRDLHVNVLDVWLIIRRRFAELRNILLEAPETIDERLTYVGLTGPELHMKLHAHQVASTRARAVAVPQPPRRLRRFFKIFASLLGWINVWLGSLVAALGAGDAVKEFKEYLEQGVDDAADLL